MNKEVSFPIAKLLKEKGFDAYCDKKYIAQCLWQKPNSREKYKNSEIHKNSGDISAPTIADVVMWFYDKHRIWISVDTDINGRFRYSLRKYNITNGAWEVKNPTSISEYFNSPTEAYEAGIEYTLNNLI